MDKLYKDNNASPNVIRNIEFVCTGNNGRSPLAQLVAEHTAGNIALVSNMNLNIKFSSSGTMVELPSNLSPYKTIIEKAVMKGILQKELLEQYDTNPNAALEALVTHEKNMRDKFLHDELKIKPQPHARNQIHVRNDIDLILPIGANNLTRVREIYNTSTKKPQIIGLEEFSELYHELDDVFPATYQEYRQTAYLVAQCSSSATKKIISMH